MFKFYLWHINSVFQFNFKYQTKNHQYCMDWYRQFIDTFDAYIKIAIRASRFLNTNVIDIHLRGSLKTTSTYMGTFLYPRARAWLSSCHGNRYMQVLSGCYEVLCMAWLTPWILYRNSVFVFDFDADDRGIFDSDSKKRQFITPWAVNYIKHFASRTIQLDIYKYVSFSFIKSWL